MSKTKVDEIRKQIDSLDNKVHDLLMKRADLVLKIGEYKRKNDIQVVQPHRETIMARRLMGRHKGPLPKEAVSRIWRELVGAVSLLQTGLKVAVSVPEGADSIVYWGMAKDYFSSVLPMQRVGDPLGVLGLVREGKATFGVLPWPDDNDKAAQWWPYLMNAYSNSPMQIVARLPLGDAQEDSQTGHYQALVVARLAMEPSGDDRSFIGIEIEKSVSRARIVDKSEACGLNLLSLHTAQALDEQYSCHLAEFEGFIQSDDERLKQFIDSFAESNITSKCLGYYPVPLIYDTDIKNASSVLNENLQKTA